MPFSLARLATVAVIAVLLPCGAAFNSPAAAQPITQAVPEPKTSIEWFERADDRMNLRKPGGAPFHMKVTFHAFPGKEFLNFKEKPEIVTGDGFYEETWLSPHEWRREVTLGGYHAIEEDSLGIRKMQASSDYEPIRVLMLLDALLNAVPRNLASKEFSLEGASGWKIDHVATGSLSLVRVSKSIGSARADYTDSFYFSQHGLLILRNERGITTGWENDAMFAGKAVPRHLTIKAGDRELLSAEVAIEEAAQIDPATFALPGGPAEPGMTLRPLLFFELRFPDNLSDDYSWVKPGRNSGVFLYSLRGVLDRHGRYKELELIAMPKEDDEGAKEDMRILMTHLREARHRSPEIDGSPAEFVMKWDSR